MNLFLLFCHSATHLEYFAHISTDCFWQFVCGSLALGKGVGVGGLVMDSTVGFCYKEPCQHAKKVVSDS